MRNIKAKRLRPRLLKHKQGKRLEEEHDGEDMKRRAVKRPVFPPA
jgi:hypothetical protein